MVARRRGPVAAARHDVVRVLVQVNSLGLGGTQLNAVDMAARLQEHGFESLLVGPADTLPQGSSLLDVAAERGVPLRSLERPRTTWDGARMLTDLANEHRADLVHVWGSGAAARGAYWGPCRLGRRPLVLTVYEMSTSSDTYRWPDLAVGTGYQLDELSGRPGPAHLVSPPVDLHRDRPGVVPVAAFLSKHGLDPRRSRVVVVSRLDESMKALSISMAIEAMALLEDVDLDLVVVGGGDAEVRLAALAAEVNRTRGRRVVTLTGAMADPRPAYDAATVVVGMGGSAARALAFAKPLVVSGEHGWFRTFTPETAQELYRHSFWSDEVEADAVGDLARILAALVADPGRRDLLGAFGREFAQRHFGLDSMAEKMAGIYHSSLASYRTHRWISDLSTEASTIAARRLGRLPRTWSAAL